MRKKSFREVIGYEPVSCRTVDPGGTGGSKCNTASRGYQRCYSEARLVSSQSKYTTGDRRAVDAYNEEEVMPMKAAPKVVWMSTFFILEKERKNEKGKKEGNDRFRSCWETKREGSPWTTFCFDTALRCRRQASR